LDVAHGGKMAEQKQLPLQRVEEKKETEVREITELPKQPVEVPIDAEVAKQLFQKYLDLEKILDESDYTYFVRYKKEGKVKMFACENRKQAKAIAKKYGGEVIRRKNKSAWRKLMRFFNLSVRIRDVKMQQVEGKKVAVVIAVATSPSGRTSEAIGCASEDEREFAKDHDLIALASTRAKNRAIADLIGFGEVSAEELEAEEK